jgi:hypothetical protein
MGNGLTRELVAYSDAVYVRDIRGHLGTIPSIVTFYIRRHLSVKGGTSERCYRTRRGRTDEQRYAIINPYLGRSYNPTVR